MSFSVKVLFPDFINSLLILFSYLSTETTLILTFSSSSSVISVESNTILASASLISCVPINSFSNFSGMPEPFTKMSEKFVSA